MSTSSTDSWQRTITQFMGHSGIQRKMPLSGRGLTFHTLLQQSRPPSTWLSSLSVKVYTKFCWASSLSKQCLSDGACLISKTCLDFSHNSQEEHAPVRIQGGRGQSADIQLLSCLLWAQKRLWANILFLILGCADRVLTCLLLSDHKWTGGHPRRIEDSAIALTTFRCLGHIEPRISALWMLMVYNGYIKKTTYSNDSSETTKEDTMGHTL